MLSASSSCILIIPLVSVLDDYYKIQGNRIIILYTAMSHLSPIFKSRALPTSTTSSPHSTISNNQRMLQTLYHSKNKQNNKNENNKGQIGAMQNWRKYSSNHNNKNIAKNIRFLGNKTSNDYYSFQSKMIKNNENANNEDNNNINSNKIKIQNQIHPNPEGVSSKKYHFSRELNNNSRHKIRSTIQKKQMMNNTSTGFNRTSLNSGQMPSNNNIKKAMNSTSFSFRPSTNSQIRQTHSQAEDHKNYLSKYQIVKELGKGTFGVVYLAKSKGEGGLKTYGSVGEDSFDKLNAKSQLNQQETQQNVSTKLKSQTSINQQQKILKQHSIEDESQNLFAIKVYQKFKMNKDPTKFKNIRKQINIMQNIQHPNIIKLYENVETLTKISLVVQYGGSKSLLQYLKQNYPIPENKIQKIGKQLLSALEYLHNRNIVHRDIKLQNILMLKQNVKLIDFGFSTLTYKDRKLNAICGTPNYMAPQVLAKKQYIGQLADIWSFGVVMFSLAQGRHPFKAETYQELDRLTNKGQYQFQKITNPIHQAFIRRVLKVKPGDRPRAAELIQHPWLNVQQQQK